MAKRARSSFVSDETFNFFPIWTDSKSATHLDVINKCIAMIEAGDVDPSDIITRSEFTTGSFGISKILKGNMYGNVQVHCLKTAWES